MAERAITFDSLYHQLPDIDNEDPEFLIDLFEDAKNNCIKNEKPLNIFYLFKEAQHILFQMKRDELHSHWHLLVSVTEPGLEVLRYFPQIAKKIDFEIDFEPLGDYVNPSVMMGFNINHWNRASRIIKQNPELARELKQMEEKPQMHLLDYGDERGLVAAIVCDKFQLVVKNAFQGEEKIAKKVAGIAGPEVRYSNNDWIIEDLIDTCSLEHFKNRPEMVGRVLGVALRKTHDLGIAYLDRFDRGHVKINTKTGKVILIDWSSAQENGDKKIDIINAVSIINLWYEEREEKIEALKNFKLGYQNIALPGSTT